MKSHVRYVIDAVRESQIAQLEHDPHVCYITCKHDHMCFLWASYLMDNFRTRYDAEHHILCARLCIRIQWRSLGCMLSAWRRTLAILRGRGGTLSGRRGCRGLVTCSSTCATLAIPALACMLAARRRTQAVLWSCWGTLPWVLGRQRVRRWPCTSWLLASPVAAQSLRQDLLEDAQIGRS